MNKAKPTDKKLTFVEEKNNYSPPKGFYDLRDFNIPNKTIFKKLVYIQLKLASSNANWQKLTEEEKVTNYLLIRNWMEASAELQQILFSYGKIS